MPQVDWLEELPIAFDSAAHKYTWTPTGERMHLSVTGVLRAGKSQKTLDTFERTKSVWAPRGTYVHSVLESHLRNNHGPLPQWGQDYKGKYPEYCVPLLDHPFWEKFQPMALEYRVCDLRRNIGGSLDVLGYDHLTDRVILLDLKTLGKGGRPYSTDAQMGGYLSMLIDHRKVIVDECLTMWAGDGECELGASQSPDRCLQAWEDAYDIWKMKNPPL